MLSHVIISSPDNNYSQIMDGILFPLVNDIKELVQLGRGSGRKFRYSFLLAASEHISQCVFRKLLNLENWNPFP